MSTEPRTAPVRYRVQLIDVTALVASPDAASERHAAFIRQRLRAMFPTRRAAPYIDDTADPLAGYLSAPPPDDADALATLLQNTTLSTPVK